MTKPFEFLIFSDFHAHNFKYGSTKVPIPGLGGLYNSRLADSIAVLDEIREYAVENEIDTAFFCGDLFHRRTAVSTDVRHAVVDRLHKFVDDSITLHMIPGNHDMGDRKGNVHSMMGLGELSDYIFTHTEVEMVHIPRADINFVFVPYSDNIEDARLSLQMAGKFADICEFPLVLMAHLGMQGAKVGSDYVLINHSDVTVSDVPHDKFAACFFGHFHEHQRLFGNGWFVGATHQHNWGDSGGSRGFLHATLEDGKVTFKQVKTSAPEFVVGREAEKVPWKANDFVRVITDKPTFTDIDALKAAMGVEHLEVVVEATGSEEDFVLDKAKMSPAAVLEQWVDAKLPEGLDKDTVLRIGRDILKEVDL